jgi:hypothetical protein
LRKAARLALFLRQQDVARKLLVIVLPPATISPARIFCIIDRAMPAASHPDYRKACILDGNDRRAQIRWKIVREARPSTGARIEKFRSKRPLRSKFCRVGRGV